MFGNRRKPSVGFVGVFSRGMLPFASLAAVAAVFTVTPRARADHIDMALVRHAPEILQKLEVRNCRNVGVLPFRLQKGKTPAVYGSAPLSSNMATRLETALLMALDPAKPIGIILKAGPVAAARSPQSHWSESNTKQRAALFDADYPLAWGGKRVKADAFLLGLVRLSHDMRTASVLIACFDHQDNRLDEITRFDVKTDRSILADAGQSFILSRGLVQKRSSESANESQLELLLDGDAADSAKNRDDNRVGSGTANEYVDFQVYYDGQLQSLSGDSGEGGESRMTPPRPGQRVEFQFRSKAQDKIGVVVFVNGKSTLESMTQPPEMCRPWVLPPGGGPYGIRGYVDDKNVLTPFKVVGRDDEAVKSELAEKLGLIEVFVLLQGKSPSSQMAISGDGKDKPADEMAISRSLSLREASPGTKARLGLSRTPRTAAEAREAAFRSRGLKVPAVAASGKKRGLSDGGYIVPDPQSREQITIPVLDLPNRILVSTPIVIRYNDRPGI
jgi:hypothetical protein